MNNTLEKPEIGMNASEQFCSNAHCPSVGLIGQGNIRVHSYPERRYRCYTCRKTFSHTTGTPLFGLKKGLALFEVVITLLAWGCPIQAIVMAFALDERTVASWRDKAGAHCEKIHRAEVVQGQLDLQQVQADEIRVRGRGKILWLAHAIMVPTRLWLGGVIQPRRERPLADELMRMVVGCCQLFAIVLVVTDGWKAYPNAIKRAFRSKASLMSGVARKGRGRERLVTWPGLMLAQVIKHSAKHRLVWVERRVLKGEANEIADQLSLSGNGGAGQLNTSYIERLNATFRDHLGVLSRRARRACQREPALSAGMWLVGTVYNFCTAHCELRRLNGEWRSDGTGTGQKWLEYSPAMASGLTERVWSVKELIWYKLIPPPYLAPKRRGRPPKFKS
jgi:transposase-like protein/IS1 family transposase